MPEATNSVFNPDIWNAGLEAQLKKDLIFSNWTNRKFEGTLAKAGDSVRILTAGSVEIKKLDYAIETDRKKFEGDLGDPQGMTGASITLTVNQIAYYQIQDSDLAKKLREEDTWDAYLEDASQQMSGTIDEYLASFMPKFEAFNKEVITLDVNNIKKNLTKLHTALKKKNVKSQLKMEVPLEFIDVLHQAYEDSQANNEKLMKEGKITDSLNASTYHTMIFEGSNNVYQDSNGVYYSALRTKRALAFVNRCSFSEKVRHPKGFSDILRGYTLFDAKVIYQKEGLCIKYKIDVDADKLVYTKEKA